MNNLLTALADEARSEAKRFGGGPLNVLHLGAAVGTRWRHDFEERFGEGSIQRMHAMLAAPPPGLPTLESVLAARPDAGSVSDVLELIAPWIPGDTHDTAPPVGDAGPATIPPPYVPPAETDGKATTSEVDVEVEEVPPLFEVPASLAAVASVVEPRTDVVGRDDALRSVFAALTRRRSGVAALVGASGVGRTTTLAAVAAALSEPALPASLRDRPLVRVDGAAMLRADEFGTLKRLLEQLGKAPVVIALDGLDLMCGAHSGGVRNAVLDLVRSVAAAGTPPLIVTYEQRNSSVLQLADATLMASLQIVDLPELDEGQVTAIAASEATRLGEHHGVSFSDAALSVATAPAPFDGAVRHPMLAVQRLDAAAAATALAGGDVVEAEAVPIRQGDAGPRRVVVSEVRARLAERVIGQVDAIDRIVDRIALTRARLDLNPHRPDGVFMFIGPTGVGKTALARAIAEEISGSGALIRLDMSEYAQEWAIARLIGPQPGYVGYTEPQGWLTTRIREQPRAVVLLDEIEKAHQRVWNTFLQVFDAGRLTDARGNVADFSEAIVIMTSNVGAESFTKSPVGFRTSADTSIADRVLDQLRSVMAPELINRIDEVAVFRALADEDITAITRLEVDRAVEMLRGRGYVVTVDDAVVSRLASVGADPRSGARHVQRNIERLLLQSLVEHEPGGLAASVADDTIVWTRGG